MHRRLEREMCGSLERETLQSSEREILESLEREILESLGRATTAQAPRQTCGIRNSIGFGLISPSKVPAEMSQRVLEKLAANLRGVAIPRFSLHFPAFSVLKITVFSVLRKKVQGACWYPTASCRFSRPFSANLAEVFSVPGPEK